MPRTKVGIMGVGMVGGPIARYFQDHKGYRRGSDLFLFDVDPRKGYADDMANADVVFVCVPTPRSPADGSCDTSIVEGAVARIGGEKIIVIKSTVSPGTTERLQKKHPEHQLLFNPEFLTERNAWEDMIHPDRQIVGFTGKSEKAAALVLSLLPDAAFKSPHGNRRISATEAELIKYAGNVYLARKVNLANALARAAERLGAKYENVRAGMGADARIGFSHLDVAHGGYRGFGGFCLPKDLDALLRFATQQGLTDVAALLQADRDFNEGILRQQGLTIEQVSDHDVALERRLQRRVQ